MLSSDIPVDLFCICQRYALTENNKIFFMNNYFQDSRTISINPNLKNVEAYLVPDHNDIFKINDIEIICTFRLFFNPKNMIEEVNELSKKINQTKAIEEFLKKRKESALKLIKRELSIDSDLLFISIHIETPDDEFTKSKIEEIWKNEKIINIFSIQEQYLSETFRGLVCGRLFYDDTFKIVGGVIPRRLPLPKEVESQVGETTIKGLNLDFTDSAIGLEKLNIRQHEDKWSLFFRIRYLAEKLRNSFPESFEMLASMSNFFKGE